MSEGAVTTSPGRLIAIGEIVGTHGVRGLLRLRPYDAPSVALAPGQAVFLTARTFERGSRNKVGDPCKRRDTSAAVAPATTPPPMVILSARPHGRILLLKLEGIDRHEAAAPFVGSVLSISEADLPAPGPGQFYAYQLENLEVFTVSGERLGRVAGTFATASNDVLVVSNGKQEFLIPCIADVVRGIDVDGGRVVIEPIEGLLA